MNIADAAGREVLRLTERLDASRQPLDRAILGSMIREAFAAGVVYGVTRSQHALAIARTVAKTEHPLDRDEPFNDGVDYGLDRAQRAVIETHVAALEQAARGH